MRGLAWHHADWVAGLPAPPDLRSHSAALTSIALARLSRSMFTVTPRVLILFVLVLMRITSAITSEESFRIFEQFLQSPGESDLHSHHQFLPYSRHNQMWEPAKVNPEPFLQCLHAGDLIINCHAIGFKSKQFHGCEWILSPNITVNTLSRISASFLLKPMEMLWC